MGKGYLLVFKFKHIAYCVITVLLERCVNNQFVKIIHACLEERVYLLPEVVIYVSVHLESMATFVRVVCFVPRYFQLRLQVDKIGSSIYI